MKLLRIIDVYFTGVRQFDDVKLSNKHKRIWREDENLNFSDKIGRTVWRAD